MEKPVLRSDYHYHLPESLIAKQPAEPRDSSRLMLLERADKSIRHHTFHQFPDFLEPGSVMVVNNSRVIPARLPGSRLSGGSLEVLLVEELESLVWSCKVKNSARMKTGETFTLCDGQLKAVLESKEQNGECRIRFLDTGDLMKDLEAVGYAPLPPYIHKVREQAVDRSRDLQDYQTVYAQSPGSIAAPTAGFHFTPEVMDAIRKKNIEILEVTLHVGLGTFEPIRVDDVSEHRMHSERFLITDQVAETIEKAKSEKRKIVAVGTTTTRTLESAWRNGRLKTGLQKTELFIYPPYPYRVVDQLLTNFHLPESTLLMLVSAFANRELILKAYREAVEQEYRFFSFGDCMFIR